MNDTVKALLEYYYNDENGSIDWDTLDELMRDVLDAATAAGLVEGS